MTPVDSSNIKAVGRDPETGHVAVHFHNGAKWRYMDVPAEAHAAWMGADSIGKHFHAHIRGKYKAERIED